VRSIHRRRERRDDPAQRVRVPTIRSAVRHLATLAAAQGLRALEREQGVSLDEVEIEFGVVSHGHLVPLKP
jgi:hypothetical protein